MRDLPRGPARPVRMPVSPPPLEPYWAAGGRLELPSPYETHDTLEYRPASSKHVGLYDGSRWALHEIDADDPPTLSASDLTARTYMIFLEQTSSGLTLSADLVPTLTQHDGIWVSGTTSALRRKRYLGLAYVNASGQFEDAAQRRFVANYYNRRWKPLQWNSPPSPPPTETGAIEIVTLPSNAYPEEAVTSPLHLHFHLVSNWMGDFLYGDLRIQGVDYNSAVMRTKGYGGITLSYTGRTADDWGGGYWMARYVVTYTEPTQWMWQAPPIFRGLVEL